MGRTDIFPYRSDRMRHENKVKWLKKITRLWNWKKTRRRGNGRSRVEMGRPSKRSPTYIIILRFPIFPYDFHYYRIISIISNDFKSFGSFRFPLFSICCWRIAAAATTTTTERLSLPQYNTQYAITSSSCSTRFYRGWFRLAEIRQCAVSACSLSANAWMLLCGGIRIGVSLWMLY